MHSPERRSVRRNLLRVLGFDRDGGGCQTMLFPSGEDEENTSGGSHGWRGRSAASRGRGGESGGGVVEKNRVGGRWE